MSANYPNNIVPLKAIADEFGYSTSENSYTYVRFEREGSRIAVNFEFLEDNSVFLYLYIRITSWDFPGERTDLNELFSVLLSLFLRLFSCKVSSSLWDIPHPAVDIETEIYARYIILNQPNGSIYQLDEKGVQQIKEILTAILSFEYLIPKMLEWNADTEEVYSNAYFSYEDAHDWATEISETVSKAFKDQNVCQDKIQYCERSNPCWKHYRNVQHGVTIYYASELVFQLEMVLSCSDRWETVAGVKGNLHISDTVFNFISFQKLKIAKNILDNLNEVESMDEEIHEISCIPIENYFVAFLGDFLLFFEGEFGKKRFEEERERARKRYAREYKLLFPSNKFIWSNDIDDDRFELFVLEILKREKGVMRARKGSVTNEGDGGVDLICEWITPPLPGQVFQEQQSPLLVRRVIVQCKAYKGSVGKSRVQDIRDTVEDNEAQGYLLVVSSHIARSLAQSLDKQRREEKYWVDWWTRTELEERLAQNIDLVDKYSDIVELST